MLLQQHPCLPGRRYHPHPIGEYTPATPAVEKFEGRVIGPYDRLVGQYRELATVADQEVLRGVIGHPPAPTKPSSISFWSVGYLLPLHPSCTPNGTKNRAGRRGV